jgi:hypothetical protein
MQIVFQDPYRKPQSAAAPFARSIADALAAAPDDGEREV